MPGYKFCTSVVGAWLITFDRCGHLGMQLCSLVTLISSIEEGLPDRHRVATNIDMQVIGMLCSLSVWYTVEQNMTPCNDDSNSGPHSSLIGCPTLRPAAAASPRPLTTDATQLLLNL